MIALPREGAKRCIVRMDPQVRPVASRGDASLGSVLGVLAFAFGTLLGI